MKQKPTLLALKGISGSGKTTYAKELEENGWVRVERDEIRRDTRLFPKGYQWPKDESKVIQERDRLIRDALKDDLHVVCSDTNLEPKVIRHLQNIARQFGADFQVNDSFLAVPLHELIDRDSKREHKVGENVIRKQFHTYVKTLPTFLQYDPNLPWCVCSDVDGTLTEGPKDRSPYDWHKVGNDDINLGVAKILDGVRVIDNTKIFLFSGRSDVCRHETEEWLERHDIEYDELFMRPDDRVDEHGNQVSDVIVKRELVEAEIKGKYNVLFWLDDRPRVARMLRDELGINVLQRGDPHLDF